jgi:hypothetical protein
LRLGCPILTRICGAAAFAVIVVEGVSAVLASAEGTNPSDATANANVNNFFMFNNPCSIYFQVGKIPPVKLDNDYTHLVTIISRRKTGIRQNTNKLSELFLRRTAFITRPKAGQRLLFATQTNQTGH